MTTRLDIRRTRAATPPPGTGPRPAARRGPLADSAYPRCERGGLDAVINDSDLASAAAHFGECTSCQAQFLAQGGLLPVPDRGTGSRPANPAGERAGPAWP